MFARQYIRLSLRCLFIASYIADLIALAVVIRSARGAGTSGAPYPLGIAFCGLWALSNSFAWFVAREDGGEPRGMVWAGALEAAALWALEYLRALPASLLPIALAIALGTIAISTSRARAAIVDGLIGIGFAILLAVRGESTLAQASLVLDALVVFATVVGGGMLAEWRKQQRMFDQARWAAAEFAHSNVRLQNSMGEMEKWGRDKERKRLAREIHDTVGYALTAILVQLSAAKELLKVDPGVIPTRLERLEELLRGTIQEVRMEVAKLRAAESDKETWRTKWLQLTKLFSDFTGVMVHAEIAPELETVDDEIGVTAYRIIQEGMTNAYRHGRASVIDVAMGWKKKAILLRISDDGHGANGIVLGSGLKGIRERVESLGGNVVWETLPNKGFDLGVSIPWYGPPS